MLQACNLLLPLIGKAFQITWLNVDFSTEDF